MNHKKRKQYKAWFSSGLSIKEIGEKLKDIGVIENYYHDYENVYEWIEANTENKDLELNISRKHCDGDGFEFEPIHVIVMFSKNEPDNYIIEEIAEEISKVFNCKVCLGFIEYNFNNKFEYKATSEIHS